MTYTDTAAPPAQPLHGDPSTAPRATKAAPRRDIQALRALAVSFVVVNHAAPDLLPGGYVGVDIFFVISGFLITKHLLGELERTGRIRFGSFYARRAARLLPAALVVSLVSLVTAWIVLPFSRWAGLAQETLAANLYVENWILALKSVDYSAQTESASTVQHYWSLSVEEQFYLVWPVLLVVTFTLARRQRIRRRALLALVLGAAFILSLLLCIYMTLASRNAAYFVTPVRAWEFAAGSLIAVQAMRSRSALPTRHSLAGIAQVLGYALILLSAVGFSERTLFPGYFALIPVVGTVLVIVSGPASPYWSPNALLAARPVQLLGDISYSLYLWHWPMLLLVPAALGRELRPIDMAFLLVGALVLAFTSKKLIEDPGRTSLLRRYGVRRSLVLLLSVMLAMVLLATAMMVAAGAAGNRQQAALDAISGGPCFGAKSLSNAECGDPFGPPALPQVGPDEAPWFTGEECVEASDPIMVSGGARLSTCDFAGSDEASGEAWLVGDSHAEHWKTALYGLARESRWHLQESLVGGCPYVGVRRTEFNGKQSARSSQDACLGWSQAVSDRIVAEKPDLVFVSAFGAREVIDDGSGRDQASQYRDAFAARISTWIDAGVRVYVLRDTPLTLDAIGPDCLAAHASSPRTCSLPSEEAVAADPLAEAALAMDSPMVKVLDLQDQFCPGGRCYSVVGGVHVYFDSNHVTSTYMRSLTPVLAQRFDDANG
ncbi:acyltransferase family protein [Arthrobacter burdickii]|uniref:Acyltransferase family protein n=1 Tax=Arthrobacter burdickii TaxID=3035920 RepID=A0ABT8K5F3_9MICC|nr:acyltransferase family protein [Arthrobacter burdickii]MDN4612031.1 acyltransferase family protein [Arthrobacter burdickii]